jgi:ATP-dependent helicase YprA (DUF1998 family)
MGLNSTQTHNAAWNGNVNRGADNNNINGDALPVGGKKPATTQRTLFGGVASNVGTGAGAKQAKIPKKKPKPAHPRDTTTCATGTSELGKSRSHSHSDSHTDSHAPISGLSNNSTTVYERRVSQAPYDVLQAQANQQIKTVFGIDALRNLQPIAIQNALQRKSQIIVMATGGGKSLCYQLPASVLGGVTLVISPLIALMVDQVQSLIARGIEAALLSSASGERHNTQILERLLGRSLKKETQKTNNKTVPLRKPLRLLYCTPELIQTARFRDVVMELYRKNSLALIAIDEAHCLSTWGHDFDRPIES